ncbi:MAG: hypothetical protein ACI4JK_06060 [Oscillospiraceae bacterium]
MKKILSAVMIIFMVMSLTSCKKSYDELQTGANAHAKEVYTAVQAAIDDDPSLRLGNYYVSNYGDGYVKVSFDGSTSTDLSPWLGNKFEGYFIAAIDSYSRTVEYALWSDHEIDLDYYDYVEYTDRAYYEGTEHAIGYCGY